MHGQSTNRRVSLTLSSLLTAPLNRGSWCAMMSLAVTIGCQTCPCFHDSSTTPPRPPLAPLRPAAPQRPDARTLAYCLAPVFPTSDAAHPLSRGSSTRPLRVQNTTRTETHTLTDDHTHTGLDSPTLRLLVARQKLLRNINGSSLIP